MTPQDELRNLLMRMEQAAMFSMGGVRLPVVKEWVDELDTLVAALDEQARDSERMNWLDKNGIDFNYKTGQYFQSMELIAGCHFSADTEAPWQTAREAIDAMRDRDKSPGDKQ